MNVEATSKWGGTDISTRPDLAIIFSLVPEGVRVLDLGCGDGRLLARLIAEKRAIGRGIELSEQNLRLCIGKGLSVRQGNLDEGLKDYPDDSFDVVILSQTLPYLDQPRKILKESLRVGHTAIISFYNMGYWRRGLAVALGKEPLSYMLDDDGPRPRPISFSSFRRICAELHLRVQREAHPARLLPNWLAESGIFIVGRKG